MDKTFLIIQPHSDDAILSCCSFILSSDDNIEVLGIENNPKRIKEDINLFKFIGVKFQHLNLDFIDNCYSGFYKLIGTNGAMEHDVVMAYLTEYFTLEVINKIKSNLIEFLFSNKDKYEYILPLGIGHPFHYFIFDIVKDLSYVKYFYREFPHSFKRRTKNQFDAAIKGMRLFYSNDDVELHDLKFKIAQKFYKSQSGFFFYEQGNIKKYYKEEIYVR